MKAARGIYCAKVHKALESWPRARLDPCPVSHPTPGTAPRSPAASEHLMLMRRDWKGGLSERGWVGEWVGGREGSGGRRRSFPSSPAAAQRRLWDGRGWRVGWKGVEGRRNGGGVEEARDGGTGSQWEGGREDGGGVAQQPPSSTCGGGGIEWEVGTAEQ